jgi:hypothetical protein
MNAVSASPESLTMNQILHQLPSNCNRIFCDLINFTESESSPNWDRSNSLQDKELSDMMSSVETPGTGHKDIFILHIVLQA